jgi:predicted MPP superfamily phosphohydrolase
MKQIIFIIIFLLIQWYASQALRTLSKNTFLIWGFWLVNIFVIANVFYQFATGNQDVNLSPGRNYSIGFMTTLMVPSLILVFFMFGEDLVRMVIGLSRKIFGSSLGVGIPSRRKFVSQIAIGIAAVPFAALLYGMYKGRYNYKVLKYQLFFPDLPDDFDGYRITQISDIHSGSFDNREKIEYAVDLINKQKSDLMLFTGDLVNNKASEMDQWKSVFSRLTAKDGIYSVLGNHDYGDYVQWSSEKEKAENLQQLKDIQKEMGFNLLLNEHRFIEKGNSKLALVGVENWGTGGFKKAGDLSKASEGLSTEEFKILMSHDPSHWQQEVIEDAKKYHLTLSGHTHGMQFGIEIPGWIKWSPVQWRYKYWAGVYQVKEQFINVNRGFGFLAYPGRVGIWPEITVIELKKGNQHVQNQA